MGRHLHFDCFSGVSGDMILGALVDAGVSVKALTAGLASMKLKGYELRAARVTRGVLSATKIDVVVTGGAGAPLSLARIKQAIKGSRLPEPVQATTLAAFDRLARAEGAAHRVGSRRVRFHEVGVLDSVIDVAGGALGIHLLEADRVSASPVNLGSGFVDFSHGRLPVPAPAVASLAEGLPVFSAGPSYEMTTPTGLALLRTVADDWGPLPLMTPRAIGHGAGTADPDGWANVLRVFVGERAAGSPGVTEVVCHLETNLDDLQPQAYDSVVDRLFAAGALDVTLTPVIMKRGRPGVVLGVLAAHEKARVVAQTILRDTTALGVRLSEVSRQVLPRRLDTVVVRGDEVRMKVAELGDGAVKAAPEYVDCRRIADQTGRPIREIMEEALRAFHEARSPRRRRTKGARRA